MQERDEPAALTALAEGGAVPVALQRLLSVTGASFEQRAHLERALTSRILIEQAKGILAERLRMRPDEAFAMLRGAARSRQLRLHDLALGVVEEPQTPAPIVAHLQSLDRGGAGQKAKQQRSGPT